MKWHLCGDVIIFIIDGRGITPVGLHIVSEALVRSMNVWLSKRPLIIVPSGLVFFR
jgi:hypothetical protein